MADGRVRTRDGGRDTRAPRELVWGEDARLAAVLLPVLRRPDVEPGVLQPWLSALVEAQSGELDPAAPRSARR
jgi:hypothetical protein